MKRHRKFISLFLLILFWYVTPFSPTISAPNLISESSQVSDCEYTLLRLTQPPDWYQQILDPVLTSQEMLQDRQSLYRDAYMCLASADKSISPDLEAARTYLEYFLIFTLGYDTPDELTYLQLVDLSTSNDPAIRQLRDDAGLPTPPGYVFVRFYHFRQAMPPKIQAMFAEDTAGLTLLTRYIAILEEDPLTWEQQIMQDQTLPKTVSHELVHAYVNATLGLDHLEKMPRWFEEGIAIHLSGSGEDHVVVGPDSKIIQTSPQDYREYRDNFKFLEAKLGRQRLLEVIRASIEDADSSLIYQDLGFTDDDAFLSAAKTYWQRRFYFISAGVIASIMVILWLLTRLMPDERCLHCGYAGKRRDFTDGYCPECYLPYDR